MQEATIIKTEDEINCLKMVATICEAGWYTAWQSLKPGIRESELANHVIQRLYEVGAEEVPPIGFYSGTLTFDKGLKAGDRIIEGGDLVYMPMCGVTYLGYKSCNFRTFITGRKPNSKETDWYKRLLERLDTVIDAIKPGQTTADAAKHFLPASTLGYRDEAEVLLLEIGHGIGLYNFGPPIINRQWSFKYPQVFESGMVIAVEGKEGESRVGGVRLENMVLVTRDGALIIDHMPRNEILGPIDHIIK
jgi:Xaa-Pro aminopeptidase